MIMQEHNDNRFTDERTKVEKYLLRMIHRYFETENIYSQTSIESIIVEALRRYKIEISMEQYKFLFSLNGKTGRLLLTIQDFGGEYAFEKNNAFNKNFGNVSGTICEGNDDRLSNKRQPLEHVHEIEDITGLRQKLNSFLVNIIANHHHHNQDVLDMLIYTGKSVEIDLIIIEDLLARMDIYYKQLNKMQNDLWSEHNLNVDIVGRAMFAAKEELEGAKEFVEEALQWLNQVKEYVTKTTNDLRFETMQRLALYLKKKDVQELIDYMQRINILIDSGEIPIPDEELKFTFKEDFDYEYEDSVDGEGIKNIYNNGLCFGTIGDMNWTWDDATQSIIEWNNTGHYTGFVSTGAFKKYTHRVTLRSNDGDDDMITVIAIYNRETSNHLEIVCTAGTDNAGIAPTTARLVYNYGYTGSITLATKTFSADNGWNSITNGMTVLIKRDVNNLKFWIIYNVAHNWNPNIDEEIIPTENPDFEINLGDYPYLQEFADKAGCYGYGCHSQAQSTYSDIFFKGIEDFGEEKPGESVITGVSTVEQSVSSIPEIVVEGKAKLFFRYDKDGQVCTMPLPYMFNIPTGYCVIQGCQDDDGKIHIDANIVNKVTGHIGPENVYDSKTLIFSSAIGKDYYHNVHDNLIERHCTLCRIDSDEKREFIKNIIRDTSKIYYINGYKDVDSENWVAYEDNSVILLPITDNDFENGVAGGNICIDAQGKLYTVDGVTSKNGYIAQYTVQRISNYFDNPRIYYQVYKEGI